MSKIIIEHSAEFEHLVTWLDVVEDMVKDEVGANFVEERCLLKAKEVAKEEGDLVEAARLLRVGKLLLKIEVTV